MRPIHAAGLAGVALPLAVLASRPIAAPIASPPPASSAAWLTRLPDGETKRRFVLDCTGCHVLDERIAMVGDRPRSEAEWEASIRKMLGFAGATTGFPVISSAREPKATAAWLARHLAAGPDRAVDSARGAAQNGVVTEYPLPVAEDLAHDVAVDSSGGVLITGMFTDRIYRLNPADGSLTETPIPVERANPRAIEVDADGRWWIVLGMPHRLASYDPAKAAATGAVEGPARAWRTYDVGMYPHSLAIAADGGVWFNGHFTRAPELFGRVDPASGAVALDTLPPHPTLAADPAGPIPYEVRVGPDGRVWGSELQGNRLLALTPATGKVETFDLPLTHAGPRRFDVDRQGVLWIPAYAANALLRFEPTSRRFDTFPLPIRDAVPYVVRVDPGNGAVWIGTAAADAVLRFDPRTRRFTTYALPSRGALVRHLAVDPRSHDLWIAYGASPGIPARVARLIIRP